MTYESLADGGFATGSMLGSGGFIVYDEDQCIVRNTWSFARFITTKAAGNARLAAKARAGWKKCCTASEYGHGKLSDMDLLVEVAKKIEGNTICPLGDAAAWPVAAAIRHFREEFEWHVKEPGAALRGNFGLHPAELATA